MSNGNKAKRGKVSRVKLARKRRGRCHYGWNEAPVAAPSEGKDV